MYKQTRVASKFYIPANCTLKSPCLCQDEYNNFVDLRPLAFRNGTSRFTDTPTPGSDDGLYSWNPCFGFTEENTYSERNKNCTDVAVCKTTKERKSFINLGIQKTAFFSHFDNGNLSLNFYSKENDPNAVQTIISLYCDLNVEAAFRCPGYMEQNTYWLQLRSKYACPTKESDLIYPVDIDLMKLTKPSLDETEDKWKKSTFLSPSFKIQNINSLENAVHGTEFFQHIPERVVTAEHETPELTSKKLSTPLVLHKITQTSLLLSTFLSPSFSDPNYYSPETDKENAILGTEILQHVPARVVTAKHKTPELSSNKFSTSPLLHSNSQTSTQRSSNDETQKKQPLEISTSGPIVPHEATKTLQSSKVSTSSLVPQGASETLEPHKVSTPNPPHVVTMTSKPDVPINTITFLLMCILMIVILILGVLVAMATYRITKGKTLVAYRRLSNEKSLII